jgi:hypothetical protein
VGDWTFDNHIIDMSVIISLLPLVVEVIIEASGDGENCAVGGEVVSLLWRFTDLEREWWVYWALVCFGGLSLSGSSTPGTAGHRLWRMNRDTNGCL